MPQNGLSGPTVGSNLWGHSSRWLASPFASAFNPITATLEVIYLFIYLFSKDVGDSYQGRSGVLFLVKRWLTSSHRSVSSSAVAADGSADRLCVCVCVCFRFWWNMLRNGIVSWYHFWHSCNYRRLILALFFRPIGCSWDRPVVAMVTRYDLRVCLSP